MRPVAKDESVLEQLALDRLDRAAHPRIGGGKEADERNQQQARIELFRAVRLHERPERVVVAALGHFPVDRVAHLAPPIDRPVEVVLFDRADGAVERDPRHHL